MRRDPARQGTLESRTWSAGGTKLWSAQARSTPRSSLAVPRPAPRERTGGTRMETLERQQSMMAAVAKALVALHKEQFGRGPTKAKGAFRGPGHAGLRARGRPPARRAKARRPRQPSNRPRDPGRVRGRDRRRVHCRGRSHPVSNGPCVRERSRTPTPTSSSSTTASSQSRQAQSTELARTLGHRLEKTRVARGTRTQPTRARSPCPGVRVVFCSECRSPPALGDQASGGSGPAVACQTSREPAAPAQRGSRVDSTMQLPGAPRVIAAAPSQNPGMNWLAMN